MGTIRLDDAYKKELKRMKIHKRETYGDIIKRILEENLAAKQIQEIEGGEK